MLNSRSQGLLILLLAGWLFSKAILAEEAVVAVASNFAGTMEQLASEFTANSGHELQIIRGSSGRFFAQISNGAPIDVLLSADQAKPLALEEAGLTVEGSRFTYAIGALVLWSTDAALVDPEGQVLHSGDFRRLAIANPLLAPYGTAAMEVLDALDLRKQVEDKLVRGENIAQAYQFVATGNANLGFVALSQVWQEGELVRGSAWMVSNDLHRPIYQDAVLLQRAKDNLAARAWLQYLASEDARTIIVNDGYRAEP